MWASIDGVREVLHARGVRMLKFSHYLGITSHSAHLIPHM